MEECRPARGDGLGERRRERLGRLHPGAEGAVGAGQGGEVRVAQGRAGDAAGMLALLVHADRAVHAVVDHDHHDRQLVLDGGGELLAGHQEAAVAGEADHAALGLGELGRDRGGQAVAHRARGRGELGPEAVIGEVAVGPDRVVARPVGEDAARRQPCCEAGHDLAELQPARNPGRRAPGQLLGEGVGRGRGPGPDRDGSEGCRRQGEGVEARGDGEVRLVDPAQLLRVVVDVDEGLARPRHVEEREALARGLAQARADGEDEVGALDPLGEPGVGADADMAGVAGVVVAQEVLAAEAAGRGQVVGGEEPLQRRGAGGGPAAAPQDGDRPLGPGQQPAQLGHGRGIGRGGERFGAPAVGHARQVGQHVLGQGQDDRAGTAGQGGGEGAVDELGDAGGILDLGDPFRHAAEHPAVVDLLEGVALAAAAVDLADEQDHRHAVLLRHVHAGAGVGGTGTAGDHGDAGPAGELAMCRGHHRRPALLAADDEADLGGVVEGVEDLEIALAGHAEDGLDALDAQLVHQDPPAGSRRARHAASCAVQRAA